MSRLSAFIPLVQTEQMSQEDVKRKIVEFKALSKRYLDSLLYRKVESELKEAKRIP